MQLNVMQYASELILHMIVIVAVIQDFKYMRISNRLIIMGLILSLVFGIFLGGVPRIFHILVNISFPVVMLYLLYLFGALGAGDIKLFSVIGAFTNFKTLTGCMLAAFAVGAVISVVKMLYNRNLRFSLFKSGVFFRDVLQGNISSYRETMAEEQNLIHFSLAIQIGLLAIKGYAYMHG